MNEKALVFKNRNEVYPRKNYVCPIAFVYGFGPHMLKYCAMHTIHLGILHWLNGASLQLLEQHHFFGPPNMAAKDMLEIVTIRFRKWCSSQGIRLVWGKKPFLFHLYVFSFFSLEGSNLSRRHSQAIISGGLFHRTAGDFVELRLKAWNSRIMTAFLTVCLDNVLKNIPAADRTPALKLTTATMHSMSTWMLRLEGADKRLSAEDAQWLWDEGNRCLALSWFLYNAMCLMSFS